MPLFAISQKIKVLSKSFIYLSSSTKYSNKEIIITISLPKVMIVLYPYSGRYWKIPPTGLNPALGPKALGQDLVPRAVFSSTALSRGIVLLHYFLERYFSVHKNQAVFSVTARDLNIKMVIFPPSLACGE